MRLLPLLICVVLTACTLALPERDDKAARPAANPITGAAIATTTLAASPAAPAPAKPVAVEPVARPAAAAKPEPPVPEVVTPARIASPAELACVKRGGSWRKAGKSSGETCFTQTRDAGKSCQRESDCQGFCLARSNTCAPFTPMFGCNDIVQDNGVMVTLCID